MRKNGYYWIKLHTAKLPDPVLMDGWEVAYFHEEEGWYSIWDGGAYQDENLEAINENILTNDFK